MRPEVPAPGGRPPPGGRNRGGGGPGRGGGGAAAGSPRPPTVGCGGIGRLPADARPVAGATPVHRVPDLGAGGRRHELAVGEVIGEAGEVRHRLVEQICEVVDLDAPAPVLKEKAAVASSDPAQDLGGGLVLLPGLADQPAVDLGVQQVGFQRERPVEGRFGLVQLVEHEVHDADHVEEDGVLRGQLGCRLERREGILRAIRGTEHMAVVGPHPRCRRIRRDGLGTPLDRLVEVTEDAVQESGVGGPQAEVGVVGDLLLGEVEVAPQLGGAVRDRPDVAGMVEDETRGRDDAPHVLHRILHRLTHEPPVPDVRVAPEESDGAVDPDRAHGREVEAKDGVREMVVGRLREESGDPGPLGGGKLLVRVEEQHPGRLHLLQRQVPRGGVAAVHRRLDERVGVGTRDVLGAVARPGVHDDDVAAEGSGLREAPREKRGLIPGDETERELRNCDLVQFHQFSIFRSAIARRCAVISGCVSAARRTVPWVQPG